MNHFPPSIKCDPTVGFDMNQPNDQSAAALSRTVLLAETQIVPPHMSCGKTECTGNYSLHLDTLQALGFRRVQANHTDSVCVSRGVISPITMDQKQSQTPFQLSADGRPGSKPSEGGYFKPKRSILDRLL